MAQDHLELDSVTGCPPWGERTAQSDMAEAIPPTTSTSVTIAAAYTSRARNRVTGALPRRDSHVISLGPRVRHLICHVLKSLSLTHLLLWYYVRHLSSATVFEALNRAVASLEAAESWDISVTQVISMTIPGGTDPAAAASALTSATCALYRECTVIIISPSTPSAPPILEDQLGAAQVTDDQGPKAAFIGIAIGIPIGLACTCLLAFLLRKLYLRSGILRRKPDLRDVDVEPGQFTDISSVSAAESGGTTPPQASQVEASASRPIPPPEITVEPPEQLLTFEAGPLGLGLANMKDRSSVAVSSVSPGSAAEAQGVRFGSFVLEVNGESMYGVDKDGVIARIACASRPLSLKLSQQKPEGCKGRHTQSQRHSRVDEGPCEVAAEPAAAEPAVAEPINLSRRVPVERAEEAATVLQARARAKAVMTMAADLKQANIDHSAAVRLQSSARQLAAVRHAAALKRIRDASLGDVCNALSSRPAETAGDTSEQAGGWSNDSPEQGQDERRVPLAVNEATEEEMETFRRERLQRARSVTRARFEAMRAYFKPTAAAANAAKSAAAVSAGTTLAANSPPSPPASPPSADDVLRPGLCRVHHYYECVMICVFVCFATLTMTRSSVSQPIGNHRLLQTSDSVLELRYVLLDDPSSSISLSAPLGIAEVCDILNSSLKWGFTFPIPGGAGTRSGDWHWCRVVLRLHAGDSRLDPCPASPSR